MTAQLEHIAEVSRNARSTWFALLGVLLFSAIALGGVRDRDFFIADAGTQLPLVNIEVPVIAFFIATPLLILNIHAYFHLYLLKLWRALRPRSAEIAPGRMLDEAVYPWLIADAAIYVRRDAPRRTLGWLTQIVSVLFGWVAGPLVLMLFWVRSWAPHDAWLSLGLALVFAVGAAISAVSLLLGRAFLRAAPEAEEPAWTEAAPFGARAAGALLAAALLVYSWERTEGGWTAFDIALYPAQLQQAEIVERPRDWVPFEPARRAFLAEYTGLARRDLDDALRAADPPAWLNRAEAAFEAFRADRRDRLRRRDFSAGRPLLGAFGRSSETDLRRANLRGAFLAGVDLSGARLDGAKLNGADLEGARLWGATLDSGACGEGEWDHPWQVRTGPDCTDLSGASLRSAILWFAGLNGARLWGADLAGADLEYGDLNRAELNNATLDGADLARTSLSGASLAYASARGANFESATLTGARMEGIDLTGARLTNVDLTGAVVGGTVTDADFGRANLSGARSFSSGARANYAGALLAGARFAGAALIVPDFTGALAPGAEFREALLAAADFGEALLTGARFEDLEPGSSLRLRGAVGDAETRLPPAAAALTIATCFDMPEFLTRRPEPARPAFYQPQAERLGLSAEAYMARFLCSEDNPKRWLSGPTLNPHTR